PGKQAKLELTGHKLTPEEADMANLKDSALDQLKAGLRGELLRPDEEGYDAARRVWNAMIDKRPLAIARCAAAADVIRCVQFARDQDLVVSMRGGGHNVAGNAVCDGGLMIDLSRMKGILGDPAPRAARAEPGMLWAGLARELHAFTMSALGRCTSP